MVYAPTPQNPFRTVPKDPKEARAEMAAAKTYGAGGYGQYQQQGYRPQMGRGGYRPYYRPQQQQPYMMGMQMNPMMMQQMGYGVRPGNPQMAQGERPPTAEGSANG